MRYGKEFYRSGVLFAISPNKDNYCIVNKSQFVYRVRKKATLVNATFDTKVPKG